MHDYITRSESDYEELTGEFPEYQDIKHQRLALAATRALRAALERSMESASDVQELWDVFQNFVRRHEHGAFVDALVGDLHNEVRASIMAEKRDELQEEALIMLRKTIKYDVADTIRKEVAAELRVELRCNLVNEIRPEVEAKLREELMGSPEFIASVKDDLKRKILGL